MSRANRATVVPSGSSSFATRPRKPSHRWKGSHWGRLERCVHCGLLRRNASSPAVRGEGASRIVLYRPLYSAIWSTFRPSCHFARDMRAARAAAGLVRRHVRAQKTRAK